MQLEEATAEIARLSAVAIKVEREHAEEVELLGAKLKSARQETTASEQGLSVALEKIKELENLNVKVKAALSEATAETGKEAVLAADMRREIKRLKEEVTVLAPLPEQLATAQQQLALLTESHSTAVDRAEHLATEAVELGDLREQLAAAVSERDAAASRLAEAQEIQEELQGADDKRKARFAKMKASYDAQLEERDATIREAEQKLVSCNRGRADANAVTVPVWPSLRIRGIKTASTLVRDVCIAFSF
jgi:chromosome segregation ATPase